MDLKTVGERTEVRWKETYETDPEGRTKKVNQRLVEKYIQGVLNDEEAAWLLGKYPDLAWETHPNGGLMVILEGRRFVITDAHKAASEEGVVVGEKSERVADTQPGLGRTRSPSIRASKTVKGSKRDSSK